METRIQRIFLKITTGFCAIILASFLAAPSWAAESKQDEKKSDEIGNIFDPKVERREVEREAIDTENWELGAYYGIISIEDFGSTELVGARVAYHVTEDFFIEASYAQATAGFSSFERLTGNVILLTDEQREYTQFNLGLGFNLLPGEGFIGDDLAFTSSLYLITALGSTDFAGEQRSTIMVGGGYRVLFTDWLAVHLTLKDHLYDIELLGTAKTASDLEISTSITIYF